MSNAFQQIDGTRRSLHVQVAREIARKVLTGELPQGEIIPSEMELCEQFGVSRTALREAVKLLTSKGLLESRPKIGTRVRSRENWNLLDSQLLEWMTGLDSPEVINLEFLALRKAIEPEAAALAAVSATAEHRIKLSEVFQRMVELDREFDREAWIETDLEFHRLIFIATGNRFYLPFANLLGTIFRGFIQHSSEEGGTCLAEHRAIYDAIMAGNPDKARQANRKLLSNKKHRLPVGGAVA